MSNYDAWRENMQQDDHDYDCRHRIHGSMICYECELEAIQKNHDELESESAEMQEMLFSVAKTHGFGHDQKQDKWLYVIPDELMATILQWYEKYKS